MLVQQLPRPDACTICEATLGATIPELFDFDAGTPPGTEWGAVTVTAIVVESPAFSIVQVVSRAFSSDYPAH
jgi:hypothetical protein